MRVCVIECRLCIIGLAASHSIPRLGKQVASINYNVGKVDRLQNQVQGKRKKGGIWMEVSSPLCEIKCTDGSEFLVLACVRGHLIEINRRLVDDPSLLSSPEKVRSGSPSIKCVCAYVFVFVFG